MLTYQILPTDFARKTSCDAIIILENHKLGDCSFDPTDNQLLENLQFISGHIVELAVATLDDILLSISTINIVNKKVNRH